MNQSLTQIASAINARSSDISQAIFPLIRNNSH